MKTFIPLIYLFAHWVFLPACAANGIEPNNLIQSIREERDALIRSKSNSDRLIYEGIAQANGVACDKRRPMDERLQAFLTIHELQQQLNVSMNRQEIVMACFRYRKGIELLKMLYEKILSLDHHFTSIKAFRDIMDMSNPNNYPEFVKIKELLKSQTRTKSKIELPQILDNNSLFSMGYTLVYSFFGKSDREVKQQELSKIACLLDFSLSMHAELKIIYYETDFLRLQNNELNSACVKLFSNYIEFLGYEESLIYCRTEDDWNALAERMELIEYQLQDKIGKALVYDAVKSVEEDISQMRFSIDQLLSFVDSYAGFVYAADMYYKKFLAIIESYEHKEGCMDELPQQYTDLRNEIRLAINKFDSAYNLAELKGSTIKDLLYGQP